MYGNGVRGEEARGGMTMTQPEGGRLSAGLSGSPLSLLVGVASKTAVGAVSRAAP